MAQEDTIHYQHIMLRCDKVWKDNARFKRHCDAKLGDRAALQSNVEYIQHVPAQKIG